LETTEAAAAAAAEEEDEDDDNATTGGYTSLTQSGWKMEKKRVARPAPAATINRARTNVQAPLTTKAPPSPPPW
jgi:hypothetical protein